MSFIRAKEIPPGSGNWYDYEVESVWNKGKVIQKHIRYLGKSTLRASHSLSGGSITSYPETTISEPATPIENKADFNNE